MPNPATVTDVQDRFWRPLSAQQQANAAVWLSDAWEMLLARRPGLEAAMTAGTVREANVVRVLSSMVIRVLENPEAKAEESIDDYRYKRHELVASGMLHVTAAELVDVTARSGSRNSVRLVVHGDE